MAGILAVAEEIDRLERDKRDLELQVAKLRNALAGLVEDIEELVANSGGVYGLHANGDPAPWEELLPGGKYGAWLGQFEEAKTALADSLAKYPVVGSGPNGD